jgi:hypothetical protein
VVLAGTFGDDCGSEIDICSFSVEVLPPNTLADVGYALHDAEAVHKEAVLALDRFAAIISLLWPSLRKPVASHVYRETDEGARNAFVFLTGVTARSKVSAVAVSVGAAPPLPERTQAQELLRRARGSPHLESALMLWADPTRSWPRLYRILEEIEQHLGQGVDAIGFCSSSQRQRFRRTANTAEASGPDARHAAGQFTPPKHPMSLSEAAGFVGDLLLRSLG